MPHTASVRRALPEYLLAHPHADLRRRLSVLRLTPFPPGSRALDADEEWHRIGRRSPDQRAYLYGTNHDALVYTYDRSSDSLVVQLAIINGQLVPD
jgi:hypothetical protein